MLCADQIGNILRIKSVILKACRRVGKSYEIRSEWQGRCLVMLMYM